jgi:hypothetical protein
MYLACLNIYVMADSLNSGIQKLGDTLSSKLFNSKKNPQGSTNFSGIYSGPGGGITRPDLKGIDENTFINNGLTRIAAFTPVGYFNQTNQWIDDKLSSIIKEMPGVSRTLVSGTILSPASPSVQLVDEDTGNLSPSGFTPVVYYRTGKEINLGLGSQAMGGVIPNSRTTGIVDSNEAKLYTKKVGDDGFYEGKESSDYRFKFGLEEDRLLTTNDNLSVTPKDNEDPLFLGFELIIDVPNSPLFNGEAAEFINMFKGNSEIKSRGRILIDTISELSKFFKFNTTLNSITNSFTDDMRESIFNTTNLDGDSKLINTKRHYIKKVSGLDKLIEANTPSSQSSFVKYRQDLIKLSFYEDTTLNLGTLASLYKALYWSRINGKNIIPENLLRFDCYIIASEVRNLTRVVKAANGKAGLETLKENVSRYVYNLYECQLFFDKMTHGDSIDIGGGSLTNSDLLEVTFSYKFSTMRFDRFNFNSNQYSFLNNARKNPTELTPSDAKDANLTGDEIILLDRGTTNTLNNGYSGKDIISSLIENRSQSDISETETVVLDNFKRDEKSNIYNRQYTKPITDKNTNSNGLLKNSGERLLQNIKNTSLNESQRQLNSQFRLVNNSLDKVKNSFGVGRMSNPTNVYSDTRASSQFYSDVKNTLRNFGGDLLGGIVGG